MPEQRLVLPGGISVELYEPRPADRLQLHAHALDCINLVLEGSLIEHTEASIKHLPVGALSLLPRGVSHAVEVGGHGARVMHAEFDASSLKRFPRSPHQPLPRGIRLDSETRELARRCRQEWQRFDTFSSLALEALATDALIAVIRHSETIAPGIPGWLEALVAHWRAHPGRHFQLTTEADSIGMSTATLSRAFKRHLGVRMTDFVIGLRIDAACELLMDEQRPLTEIATSQGFADHSHFCRCFKRAMGLSPSAWRRRDEATAALLP